MRWAVVPWFDEGEDWPWQPGTPHEVEAADSAGAIAQAERTWDFSSLAEWRAHPICTDDCGVDGEAHYHDGGERPRLLRLPISKPMVPPQ